MKFENIAALDRNIGWRPRAWRKRDGWSHRVIGKLRGRRRTPGPAQLRREARNRGARRSARR